MIVDTLELSNAKGDSLDLSFSVSRSLKTEPNTCELKIWNLNLDHRNQLDKLEGDKIAVQVEAGYQGNTCLLFLGWLRYWRTAREGADLVTTITSGDGEKERKKRVNVALAKNTTPQQAFTQIANAMGLAEGNAKQVLATSAAKSRGLFSKYGTVLSGQATREMDLLAAHYGCEWSIQNGAVQLLQKGKALASSAIDLAPDKGLLGTPALSSKGVLTGKCLLIPDMFPGRVVSITSENLRGWFRLEKCGYSGDTRGEDWSCTFEATRLKQ